MSLMLPAVRRLSLHLQAGEPAAFDTVIAQINRSGGCVAAAARALAVGEETFRDWISRYPELRAAVDAARPTPQRRARRSHGGP